ncbi:DinB family protein [Hymenobacter psychrophilus]|uniref:DinB superfamily protein n=1 Tax=Hymenobacter psychrophilus TaxID=651662 RepID=A0A1H3AZJ9_9BACT|nr:DinB family protein [Hymenobacter psychrophilus]SDX34821.1 DinB superfamily protein [Hymenobacter psychrophilus]
MNATTYPRLLEELEFLLTTGNAHVSLEDACVGLTPALINAPAPGLPHTIWQLAEHLRLAQWDIVEFCLNPAHVSPEFPAGYWPAPTPPADVARWQTCLAQLEADRTRFLAHLRRAPDLLAPLPHGTGQSLLREALLIADHNAYHVGQIVLVRQLLGAWV